MGGISFSSWVREGGTVRWEEYCVVGLGGGEALNLAEKGEGRVKRSYPGTMSESDNGTVTGVGFDLAEFSRRK